MKRDLASEKAMERAVGRIDIHSESSEDENDDQPRQSAAVAWGRSRPAPARVKSFNELAELEKKERSERMQNNREVKQEETHEREASLPVQRTQSEQIGERKKFYDAEEPQMVFAPPVRRQDTYDYGGRDSNCGFSFGSMRQKSCDRDHASEAPKQGLVIGGMTQTRQGSGYRSGYGQGSRPNACGQSGGRTQPSGLQMGLKVQAVGVYRPPGSDTGKTRVGSRRCANELDDDNESYD